MKRLLLALVAATAAMISAAQAGSVPTNALGEPLIEQYDPNAKPPAPYGSKEQKAQAAEEQKKIDKYLEEHYPNGIPHRNLWYLADAEQMQCVAGTDNQVTETMNFWASQGHPPMFFKTQTGQNMIAIQVAGNNIMQIYKTVSDCKDALAITAQHSSAVPHP